MLIGILGLVTLCLLSLPLAQPSQAAPPFTASQIVPLHSADLVGVFRQADRYELDGSLMDVPAYAPYTMAGLITTRPMDAGEPIAAVRVNLAGWTPDDGEIRGDVRGSIDGTAWTSWLELPVDGPAVFSIPVRFLQYRLTLLASSDSPRVEELSALLQRGEPRVSALQSRGNPTVRVFGTREGLIGHKTANGHTIARSDRFVALPSRKALNPLGKTDYRVRITYRDRSVEAPVWDVGPWNIKDNYWDESREMFSDLPRFVPQAFAAWADNHNGGKDGSGRWVTFPASIDISDAAFIDDLKMGNSAYVDVTFLWVDAVSPPPGATPPVTGLKPLGSKGMQAGGANATPSSAAPAVSAPSPAPPPSVVPPSVQTVRPHQAHLAYVPVDTDADSWIVMQNPSDQAASAELRFSRVDGGREQRSVSVAGGARYAVSAGQLVSSGEYSVVIESDRPLAAERSIFLGADALTTSAVAAPSRTWFFAEGSTEAPLETLIALFNPNSRESSAKLTFFGDRGRLRTADVRLAPGARTVVNLAEMVSSGGVSTVIETEQPLVAERVTFLNGRSAGDGAIGSVAASATWSFADANTTPGSDSWLVLLNPTDVDATVQARMLGASGSLGERTYSVPARARLPILLNQEFPEQRFGIVLGSDQPIVAERSEYLNEGNGPIASASVIGTIDAGSAWTFPEGAGQSAQSASIALMNASDTPAAVRLDLIGDKGRVTNRDVRVSPQSTHVFEIPRDASESTLSVRVNADRPITVERQIRLSPGKGATGSGGIRL